LAADDHRRADGLAVADALVVQLLARLRVVARQDALVVRGVELALPHDRRRNVAVALADALPDAVRPGHVAAAGQPQDLARPRPAGVDEEHVALRDRHRFAEVALFAGIHPQRAPALLAGGRVVAPQAERPVQDEVDPPALHRQEPRRAEPAALVARRRP